MLLNDMASLFVFYRKLVEDSSANDVSLNLNLLILRILNKVIPT